MGKHLYTAIAFIVVMALDIAWFIVKWAAVVYISMQVLSCTGIIGGSHE